MFIGATYMTAGQQVELGGLHFTVIRIVCLVGLFRVMLKGERIVGGWQTMDRLVSAWCVWLVLSGLFHKEIGSALIYRSGYVFDNGIIYFLFRVFIRDIDEFLQSCKIIIMVLAPLAMMLVVEKMKGFNCFSFLGIPAEAGMRDGKIRAQGPFAHAILAGTVGAVCLLLGILFWTRNRRLALIGVIASAAMVYASASSGPIMTTLTILFGLALWWVRGQMRAVRWGAVGLVFALSMVMQAPVYYLLAKIDLTGSSTGWHRAYLIETSINHLGEWWLVGTDYTRHWISYGVAWSGNQIDITNHYIQMGVLGGLPLMLLFMGVLVAGFAAVGKALRRNRNAPIERQFLIWTLGAILFGHAITFLSISYFDQTIVFFHFLLAAIGSLHATELMTANAPVSVPRENTSELPPEHEQDFCYHC
jgi:O-antigen ligase